MNVTPNEMMTIAAARALKNDDVCFVGIGAPSAACNVARLTHAPGITLIYESGTIGTAPDVLPLSIGDGELCDTALCTVSVPEMFRYWLQIDFVTSFGHGKGGDERARLGLKTKGPTLLITDLAVWRTDSETKEFVVASLHPGVTRSQVEETCGWKARFASQLDETPLPSNLEIETLRELQARTKAAHDKTKSGGK